MEEHSIVLPPGVERPSEARVIVDNRTGLADAEVLTAVETHFVEHSSLLGANQGGTFQTYSTSRDGSLLARSKFKTPANVFDEIKLARDLAERDDDVAATIGTMLAVAFGDGMENNHEDVKTERLFNGVASRAGLDHALKELYREYIISGQVTSAHLFIREQLEIDSETGDSQQKVPMSVPLIGVLPAENIRLLGNDLFGEADLAFVPEPGSRMGQWLEEFFGRSTTPARKAELRRADPVSAALFVEQVDVDNIDDLIGSMVFAYRLNPRMVARSTMPKGAKQHPTPPLTRNFALLEAKRLLNIMDFALLQGGANFIVVAKKGDKDRPAHPDEITNLADVVRRSSRSGVIIGDHRLSFEIITPDLTELLNPDKRRLIGRKLAQALLRLPEHSEGEGGEGVKADIELLSRVIAGDRRDIKRHVERHIYGEVVKRNPGKLKGAAKLWFPKIVLQGTQFFTDYVLKLRDRGDIPRKYAVEAAGFDWEAGVAQRKRELKEDIDETMMPAAVPFSDAEQGPQDNNTGRPRGSSQDNGRPGAKRGGGQDRAAPKRTLTRNSGETVKAIADDEHGVVRIGELTQAILEQYPDREVGRVTKLEREGATSREPIRNGPLAIVPVNVDYDVAELRAVRLAEGLSILVGERRGDQAVVAKALVFREPEFDVLKAEETALRWGYDVPGWAYEADVAVPELPPAPAAAPELHVHQGGRVVKRIRRDDNGNIVEIEELPVEEQP